MQELFAPTMRDFALYKDNLDKNMMDISKLNPNLMQTIERKKS
jgi:hypothetical protein